METSVQMIGILNVTPDSYYDGGKFIAIDMAVKRAGEMLHDGADWIEVGGESTGPGSKDIPMDEELARTIPVIKALRKNFPQANISIDTYKADVACAALESGATMVNDVTSGRGGDSLSPGERVRERGSKMFSMLKNADCHVVLMHSKDNSPRTTIQNTQYKDVIHTVKSFLQERTDAAMSAGISKERIIIDPGMGHFVSSDPTYSFQLIARLTEFQEIGCPLLLSPSRKSFLSGSAHLPPSERLPGTIAASAIAVLHGASYIRTHDVKEVGRGCEIASIVRTFIK